MPYIPQYLTNVERDLMGWPVELETEERDLLVLVVQQALEAFGGTATLSEIHDYTTRSSVASIYKQYCPVYYKATFWDFKFACLDRALRKAPTSQVWRLDYSCDKEEGR